MSPNSVFRGQPALGVDRELERRVRRRGGRAEHAGGDLDVLLADRADDVAWPSAAATARRSGSSQTRMLYSPAPNTCTAPTPADAGQLVLDPQVRVVREVEHVVAVVGRDEVHDHDEVGRGLLRGDADALHVLRAGAAAPAPRGSAPAPAALSRSVPSAEGDRQRHARRRRSPARTCRACPRRRSSAARAAPATVSAMTFGLAPGIRRAHDDRRRHDARVLADRQLQQRQRAGDDDQQPRGRRRRSAA